MVLERSQAHAQQAQQGLRDNYPNQPLPLSFSDLLQAITKLYELFTKQYVQGQQTITIEVLTVSTTAAALYTASKLVRGGTLMNLSATDNITIGGGGEGQKGKVAPLTAGAGVILNNSAAVGAGGGTFNFGNIDLSTLTAITNTNTGQKLAVVYYN